MYQCGRIDRSLWNVRLRFVVWGRCWTRCGSRRSLIGGRSQGGGRRCIRSGRSLDRRDRIRDNRCRGRSDRRRDDRGRNLGLSRTWLEVDQSDLSARSDAQLEALHPQSVRESTHRPEEAPWVSRVHLMELVD